MDGENSSTFNTYGPYSPLQAKNEKLVSLCHEYRLDHFGGSSAQKRRNASVIFRQGLFCPFLSDADLNLRSFRMNTLVYLIIVHNGKLDFIWLAKKDNLIWLN